MDTNECQEALTDLVRVMGIDDLPAPISITCYSGERMGVQVSLEHWDQWCKSVVATVPVKVTVEAEVRFLELEGALDGTRTTIRLVAVEGTDVTVPE